LAAHLGPLGATLVWTLLSGVSVLGAMLLAVPKLDRAWIAAVLTAQWALGAALTLAAFALLGWLLAMMAPEVGASFLA
jgi:hypothetical protein